MATLRHRQQIGQALLLESDPGLARVLELMLRQAGYLVKPCSAEAEMAERLTTERLRAEGIDLVLADLSGSGPGAGKLVAQLRGATALLPVIVITPYGQEKHGARLAHQPGCHFLTSPLEPEDLRRCLARVTASVPRGSRQISHNG